MLLLLTADDGNHTGDTEGRAIMGEDSGKNKAKWEQFGNGAANGNVADGDNG